MGFSRKPMSFQFSVMLRLPLLSSPAVANSMSSVAALACSKHLKGTKSAAMVQWKSTNLPKSLRNLLGEDLGPLNSNDLEKLERQLESSLKQVRSIKTQYMLDQLSDLQNKEQLLLDSNRTLTIKLDEICSRNHLRQTWDQGGEQSISYGPQNAQIQGFFQPLDCNPTLQIGYNASGSDQINATTHAQQVNGFIPGWML
ncbi:hypothetical protein I3843_04G046900 [Carya illinoinensis]|uniref:K-box domain-containing protein n=1 Tax=Carya illinoinensis TaxID=32201 RepID=A0A922F6Y2_CARIL|nr:agamous-like MADS-box protein MADS2 isoform X3 [Carya illinoinensis]KAG2710899.1 hypothetical protein I3760_04G051000 [Carya illinoinensis]KAG6716504.1 hypothetical protein I3842_04G052400 [Carya illinoinensis]KAG7982336.1 hypothetical protein I3843_04G046900 [Carya illinoinensis]